MPIVPVIESSHHHFYNVTMSTGKVHQTAPGGRRAHFSIVHDVVPQFGSSVVLNLITVDLIRTLVGDQNVIGIITFSRRNQFHSVNRRGFFFGEGASDNKRMTSCGNHSLNFRGQCGFVPLVSIVRDVAEVLDQVCASSKSGTISISLHP